MSQPFEGLLGGNCELRIIEFLLPLKDMDFNITELAEEVGVSRPTADHVIKKFVDWGIMKITQKRGGTTYYQLNFESPFITLFENLNNLVIEKMLDEETLFQISDYWKEHAPKITPIEKQLKPESTISSQFEKEEISWIPVKKDIEPDFEPDIIPTNWMKRFGGNLNAAGKIF